MIDLPKFELVDPKVHFNHRFSAFLNLITPTPLTYEQFVSNISFTNYKVFSFFLFFFFKKQQTQPNIK